MKLVVLASFFPTLLTSPVFLIMHLLLPLLRPCSNGNPREGNVFVFLRPLCICIPGQHYACGCHPNSCIPHAVLVSLILVQHFTDLHAKVPATNGVPGSEGHIMLCTLAHLRSLVAATPGIFNEVPRRVRQSPSLLCQVPIFTALLESFAHTSGSCRRTLFLS